MTDDFRILAIDQGTSSSRAIVFGQNGAILAQAQQELPQLFPANGWVEQDPEEIWQSVLTTSRAVLQTAAPVAVAGLTNQRETVILWQRRNGRPIHNAIVWQDRRTADLCQELRRQGHEADVTARTGLPLDPYFSASKITWLLNTVPGARAAAEAGDLAFGTVDSFLLWRLTGGQVHATDATNAARTSLFNIHDNCWDPVLLKLFDVPAALLPEVHDCATDFGTTAKEVFNQQITIGGVAGDQQAASFGQACFEPGMLKSTYGTGCFLLMNVGAQPAKPEGGLLSTIGYRLDGRCSYGLEGSIFAAGSTVQWLRDGIGVVESAAETESLAASLDDNKGVYLVPAFTGLGAPHWDSDVRGALIGLTRDSGAAELARAALEAVCYQTYDILEAMASTTGITLTSLRVDGGMVRNDWLLTFLADLLDLPIDRPEIEETTALGVAALAGLHAGLFSDLAEIAQRWRLDRRFIPTMEASHRAQLVAGWRQAVAGVRQIHKK